MKIYEFKVGVDYLPYVLKGDTALFDWAGGDELKQEIDSWLTGLTNQLGKGRFLPIQSDDGTDHEFTECDITGEYSMCAELGYLVM